jgi:hypothetical protein
MGGEESINNKNGGSLVNYISSESWEAAALAIAVKVSSTFVLSLALVSKYSRLLWFLHHYLALRISIFLSFALSILFPMTMNGKLSGSLGVPYMRNSSFQDSNDSKL